MLVDLTIDSITLMAIGTMILAIITVISTMLTQRHNKRVDEYNKQTLEVMQKSHEPALSLDLWKKELVITSTGTRYTYGITVRNDGMGPAIKVNLQYQFGRMRIKPGEIWEESEKDFGPHIMVSNLGNIAPGRAWEGRLGDLKEKSSDLGSIYAVRLKASCEDVFGKKNYEVEQTVHLEDAEER